MKDRDDVEITAINFMAVSLGGLEGAYLSVIDADEGKIGIDKYLLVNPPVDLGYAVKKIDEWNALENQCVLRANRWHPVGVIPTLF